MSWDYGGRVKIFQSNPQIYSFTCLVVCYLKMPYKYNTSYRLVTETVFTFSYT